MYKQPSMEKENLSAKEKARLEAAALYGATTESSSYGQNQLPNAGRSAGAGVRPLRTLSRQGSIKSIEDEDVEVAGINAEGVGTTQPTCIKVTHSGHDDYTAEIFECPDKKRSANSQFRPESVSKRAYTPVTHANTGGEEDMGNESLGGKRKSQRKRKQQKSQRKRKQQKSQIKRKQQKSQRKRKQQKSKRK